MSLKNSFVSERPFFFFYSILFRIVDCGGGLGWHLAGGGGQIVGNFGSRTGREFKSLMDNVKEGKRQCKDFK